MRPTLVVPVLVALSLVAACAGGGSGGSGATGAGTDGGGTTAATSSAGSSGEGSSGGAPTSGTSAGPGTGGVTSDATGAMTGGSTGGGVTTGPATSGLPGPSPDDPALECADPPCFNVINRCGVPLTIHAANNANVVLQPDLKVLQTGDWQQYPVPPEWPAGRIVAYTKDPVQSPEAHEKVEVTVTGGIMNYNITFVDYVSLPSEMRAVGPNCPKTADFDPQIGCYVERDALLAGCPDDLLAGDRCLSANLYCADGAHKDLPYCHALDAAIAACVAQHPETCGLAAQLGSGTPEVYACAGYFDSQPANCAPPSPSCHAEGNRWCAALNRGMLAAPEDPDPSHYYQAAPYNTYSKWVHETCPGIYAFAYDDYPANANESGFRACEAPRLDVVFCPVG